MQEVERRRRPKPGRTGRRREDPHPPRAPRCRRHPAPRPRAHRLSHRKAICSNTPGTPRSVPRDSTAAIPFVHRTRRARLSLVSAGKVSAPAAPHSRRRLSLRPTYLAYPLYSTYPRHPTGSSPGTEPASLTLVSLLLENFLELAINRIRSWSVRSPALSAGFVAVHRDRLAHTLQRSLTRVSNLPRSFLDLAMQSRSVMVGQVFGAIRRYRRRVQRPPRSRAAAVVHACKRSFRQLP